MELLTMSERLDGIATELLDLRDDEGKISAPDAVEWARSRPNSHLHGALEWDDSVAGERYRVWQVRSLISVHLVDADGGRRFVSLTVDRAEGGYRPLNEVMQRIDLRQQMLDDALADLDRIQKKYQHLQELSKVWAARDQVKVTRTRRRPSPSQDAAD